LKCYQHQTIDAVGVCTNCGRGICDACAVSLGGKLYCKPDADAVFKEQKEKVAAETATKHESARPMSLTVASILLVIYGIAGIVASIAIIGTGVAVGGYSSLGSVIGSSAVATGLETSSIAIYLFGVIYLFVSVSAIIAGWWLWRTNWRGALLSYLPIGLTLLVGAVLIGLSRNLFAVEISSLLFGWGIVMCILIIMGRNSIE
jgi:hypothetical protein